jgi:nucleotide-binding universal stress UspA family protein
MPASDEARSSVTTRSEQPGGLRIAQLVVGYDGSDGAVAAADFALWLAGQTECEVTVVHAGPTPETVPSADLLPSAAEQVVAYERE